MAVGSLVFVVERLAGADIVAVAQCIAIDAEAFPYASAQFGMRSASARVWIAHESGVPRVLGFVAGRARNGVLHVGGLAVDRASRRRGLGRALMRDLVEHTRAEGLRAVALQVSVRNRAAIALYDAEGFAVVRRLRGFYPAAAFDGEADAYEMVLRLF
jgi:[ribosomal protein S18]-alanine N-acetyltransferase